MRRSAGGPLVARREESAALLAAVERASGGKPGVVLLGGDAGVGKSRLLAHVMERARRDGAVVVTANCVDLGEVGIPYLPFTEALTQLQGGGAGPEVAERVQSLVAERPALWRLLEPGGGGQADHGERLQLFDGIVRSLEAAGEAGHPLLLVLEDMHWADASSRDALRFVVSRLRSQHVACVVSYRTDDVDRRHPLRRLLAELHRDPSTERVDLAPFTTDELREFTTALAGGPLPGGPFEEVRVRSEGNAFFAEELVEAGPGGGLPWSLADVLHARLERLDPAVQQVVRLASVAGRRVREDVLRAAAVHLHPAGAPDDVALTGGAPRPGDATAGSAERIDAALREAVAHQVLGVEDGYLAFRHALLAEALYLDLLPGERAAAHRAYLAALADADPSGRPLGSPAERAHHALQAHDLPTALVASRDAARRAGHILAPEEQLRHLEQVLNLWDSVPGAADLLGEDRVDVALAASDAAVRAGHSTRSVRLARRAVEALAHDPVRQATARHVLARRLLDIDLPGSVEESMEQTAAALDALPDESSSARAWTLAIRARAAMYLAHEGSAEDVESRQVAEQAIEVARAVPDPGAEADALTTLAVLLVGDADESARLLESARRRAADAGEVLTELRCWYNIASNRFYAGHLEAAQEILDQALSRAEELGLGWSGPAMELRVVGEVCRYFLGDLADRPVGDVTPEAAPWLAGSRMYAAVARGDADVVERGIVLRSGWDHDAMIALVAGGCLVDALTWAGRYEEAVTIGEELTAHLGAVWSEFFLGRVWLSALAIAALADAADADPGPGRADPGRVARGDALLAVARETARRGRPRGGVLGPEGRAWLQRAEAENARLRAVADPSTWRDSAHVWQDTVTAFDFGYRYEVARSRYRWAEALLGAGERELAGVEATKALVEADAMGAAPLAGAVRALARRGRLDLPGVRHATTSALTDREEEVLTLVAQGLSNRQIGERLFISTKTVSVHVSNVLAKLGASGRAEAVSLAHQRGLLRA
ncbi:helix-turn-helix transcriptional regulator [Antribacter gilvus]|uniref:helix-turn-helix transcriptional regulator n=1 Tax=Antribacter gilvus TaxID=2304675 RepID=UPI001980E4AA|nr:helix-turn-helix transcriptional regulator [Antribacter gilvus]